MARWDAVKTRMVSIILAVLSFAALSAVNVIIFVGLRARNVLESQNDGSRTINLLLASLRNHEDFGAVIENNPALERTIIGVGAFASTGEALYSWGAVPATCPAPPFREPDEEGQMADLYTENPRSRSMVIVLRPSPKEAPPPGPSRDEPPDGRERSEGTFMSDTLRRADFIYLEILQAEFWRRKRLQAVLLPVVEAMLLVLVAFVRYLILRNAEYRERIEKQKNLVMLGSAASTLAHEIKNPLLAIRLQTGILSRTLGGAGERELAIIDDEVNRLSMLSHRVNDILRDPTGRPECVSPADIAGEVGMRLCGRPVVTPPPARAQARIDPERLRSVIENLLRNALEAGGKDEEVSIEVSADDGHVRIDVLDRGTGIPDQHREIVFDPFFTTKSRGSGIGLAICRRFVLAAGGTIVVGDRPGGGCRMRVVLPACSPGAPPGKGS